MHSSDLILTLTAGLGAALVLGYLALKLRLPPIVGYLVAGLLLGSHTPGFVANRAIAGELAEIGVILLMFGVGLHFHLDDFLAVRGIALTGALVQISVVTALGVVGGRSFGRSFPAAAIFGFALSIASTVVVTRVLADNADLHSQSGRIAVGWLVVEDIFTVFVLVILPTFSGTAENATGIPLAIAIAGLKLAALTAITLGAGGRLIPRLLTGVARTDSRELFTLTILVIALGISVAAARIFGVSMALGAFLAGMVVGRSEFSFRAASEALPMRDAFAVLFFVSVGMLFNPEQLTRAPLQIIVTTAIILIAKPVTSFLIVVLLRYGARTGVRVGVARAQIGEFSFILAALGTQLRILPDGATDSLVAASIVTITLNPLLYRLTPAIETLLTRSPRLRRLFAPKVSEGGIVTKAPGPNRAVIVGYGPVGQTVSELLRIRGIEPTVIELNLETVRRLNSEGARAVYGDAMNADILEEAGVATALGLILSAPASPESAELIRIARQMNPQIRVLVRCKFLSLANAMRQAGADEIFSGEAEVAMAMNEYILKDLGTTPEQMDLERVRFRKQLYGQDPLPPA